MNKFAQVATAGIDPIESGCPALGADRYGGLYSPIKNNGCGGELFTPEAAQRLHELAGDIPRR